MEFLQDKQLTEEEIKKIADSERKRLGMGGNKPLPMGFESVYMFHLGTIYPDENIISALLGLNFGSTLKNIIKMFKDGNYGEISKEDEYNNQESLFFGNLAGMFGCYKTRYGYVRIDVVKTNVKGSQGINTYISLTKEKNIKASYNLIAEMKLNKYLNDRAKNTEIEKI